MLTLFFTVVLISVWVFLGLTAQRWLFRNSAKKYDSESELYQQLLKSARVRARSDEKYNPEWELYQERYD